MLSEFLSRLPTTLLYTDPGSGALLLQLIAAAILGALFYLGKFKTRIVRLFTRKSCKADEGAVTEKAE